MKSMKVHIDHEKMAMAMLDDLPDRFDPLISALSMLEDDKTFTFEFVKSRLLQEKQRNQQRVESSLYKTEESALVSKSCVGSCSGCNVKSLKRCSNCGKTGHSEDLCFTKQPHLRKNTISVRKSESKHLLQR